MTVTNSILSNDSKTTTISTIFSLLLLFKIVNFSFQQASKKKSESATENASEATTTNDNVSGTNETNNDESDDAAVDSANANESSDNNQAVTAS